MKRVLTILAILLLPLSVWAMTPVTDSDLSNVTGQAGVNINADLNMNILIGTMAWGDSDGVKAMWNTRVYSGGFVGIDNFNLTNLRVSARAESTDNWNGYSTFFLKPITIDVATGDKTAVGGQLDQTFVRFGLGSLRISMDALSFNVGTSAGYIPSGTAVTISDIMGSVNMGDMTMYIAPTSYVDIFSHAGTGVSFQMRVTIDRFAMGYLSWGDADGLNGVNLTTDDVEWIGATHSNGFIGLDNMNFGSTTAPAFTITGTAAIDVVTSQTGEYAVLNMTKNYLFNLAAGSGMFVNSDQPTTAELDSFCNNVLYPQQGIFYPVLATAMNSAVSPITVVHISFPEDFNFTMGAMRTAVKLGNNANLTTTGGVSPKEQVLGDIYIGGLDFTIQQGSWVDIWAH